MIKDLESFYAVKDTVYRRVAKLYQIRNHELDRDFDDLFQEAVIKLWKMGKSFDNTKGLVCYLAIAIKTAKIDSYRKDRAFSTSSPSLAKKDRAYSIEILDFIRDTRVSTAYPDRDTTNRETKEILGQLITEHLTQIQQQAVFHVYYHNKTYREAADIMNCSVSKVRDSLHDAIRILKQHTSFIADNCQIIEREHKPLPNRPTKTRKEKKLNFWDDYCEEDNR